MQYQVVSSSTLADAAAISSSNSEDSTGAFESSSPPLNSNVKSEMHDSPVFSNTNSPDMDTFSMGSSREDSSYQNANSSAAQAALSKNKNVMIKTEPIDEMKPPCDASYSWNGPEAMDVSSTRASEPVMTVGTTGPLSSGPRSPTQKEVHVPRVVSTLMPSPEGSRGAVLAPLAPLSPQPNGTIISRPTSAPMASPPTPSQMSPSSSLRNKNGKNPALAKPTVRKASKTAAKLTRNPSMCSSTTLDSQATKGTTTTAGKEGENETAASPKSGDPLTKRRQKRLERNRESARLSRRRRKQYLEVLEERVTKFSHEMDKGRREHVADCLRTLRQKRSTILQQHEHDPNQEAGTSRVHSLLKGGLSRCSQEMMVTSTFRSQQVKSFVLPPSTKCIMWLTLQTDAYFRGGRAASERLSAARIGDKLLNSGTDRVTPAESMWPLLCSEIGLSYEQEEKVRTYQAAILQTPDSWLDRHTTFSLSKTLESAHQAVQAVTLRIGQRERSNLSFLSDEQKLKYLSWSEKNRDKIRKLSPAPRTMLDEKYKLCDSQHTAANLYVLNHRFQTVLKKVPPAAPLVTGLLLRKLSRRPSFESLGSVAEREKMSRNDSCASMSSMQREASEESMEGNTGENGEEKPSVPAISPSEAQATFTAVVDETLGPFKEIIPSPPIASESSSNAHLVMPAPTPVSDMCRPTAQPVASAPVLSSQQQPYYHQPPAYPQHPTTYAAHPPQHYPYPLLQPEPHHFPHQQAPASAVSAPVPSAAPMACGPPQPPFYMGMQYYMPPPPPQQHAPALQPPMQPQHATLPPAPQVMQQQQQQQHEVQSEESHHHRRAESFFPSHLNVVPEDMFPVDAADEFLMKLVDEDWAIGEGIDMEMDHY